MPIGRNGDSRISTFWRTPTVDHLLDPDTVDEMVCTGTQSFLIPPGTETGSWPPSSGPPWSMVRARGNAACMENDRCTKKYPRPFSDETSIGEDDYPSIAGEMTPDRAGDATADSRWG